MAILDVVVPQLSESVAEATLLQWHKKVGEAVARDENLIDIETDKVVLELPAPAQGVITEIIRGDGSTVVAGENKKRVVVDAVLLELIHELADDPVHVGDHVAEVDGMIIVKVFRVF